MEVLKMTKQIDELRYGKWWAVDYWLVRVIDRYDEVQAQEAMYKEMFGEPNDDDKYGTWQKQAAQLRKETKRLM